jgi:tetratricopeptide (TPR) repeat protein
MTVHHYIKSNTGGDCGVLCTQIGIEWARLVTVPKGRRDRDGEAAVRWVLALPDDEFPGALERFAPELSLAQGMLFDEARAALRSAGSDGDAEVERIGRVLVGIGYLTEPGRAAGHFLVGYSLRSDYEEGPRHFELARRAYVNVRDAKLAALAILGAEAARSLHVRPELDTDGLSRAFAELASVDGRCAERLRPAMRRHLTVIAVVQSLMAGRGLPQPPEFELTSDEVTMAWLAVVGALDQPTRAMEIARWIRSLPGRPARATTHFDSVIAILEDAGDWNTSIPVLKELMAGGDKRIRTLVLLAKCYFHASRPQEAKALLRANFDSKTIEEQRELLEEYVIFGTYFGDPDTAVWEAELRRLGGTLSDRMGAPPSMLEEQVYGPELLARYDNGKLTIDPRLATLGPDEMKAHILAATIVGLGRDKGTELRDSVSATDPRLFPRVVALLPPAARPITAADRALGRAEEYFRQREFRAAIPAYEEAIRLDPTNESAQLGLGDAYFMLHEWERAAIHFEESIAIRPTPQAYRFLGDAVYRGRGDADEARRHYEKALALDPRYPGARAALESLPPRRKAD